MFGQDGAPNESVEAVALVSSLCNVMIPSRSARESPPRDAHLRFPGSGPELAVPVASAPGVTGVVFEARGIANPGR